MWKWRDGIVTMCATIAALGMLSLLALAYDRGKELAVIVDHVERLESRVDKLERDKHRHRPFDLIQ